MTEETYFSSSDDNESAVIPIEKRTAANNTCDDSEEQPNQTNDISDLTEFVRALMKVSDKMALCKEQMKPYVTQMKEMKQKYNQLRVIVSRLMQKYKLETIEPESEDGVVIAKLTVTKKERIRPTMAALEKAVLDDCFNGDGERLNELRIKALKHCPPNNMTLRCTRRKPG